MGANTEGLSFHRTSWTGSVTLTNEATAATSAVDSTGHASRSAAHFLNSIVAAGRTLLSDSTFAWAVNNAGRITLSGASNFSLTFTGVTAARLGFSTNKSGASSYLAESVCGGVFSPYSNDALLFASNTKKPTATGLSTSSGAIWMRTPSTDPEQPVLIAECLRAGVLQFVEAHAVIGTPAKVDVFDSSKTLTEFTLGGVRVTEEAEVSGWSSIELEVVS